MNPVDEKVDILVPPKFEKGGVIKTLEQAWNDEEWIGTFNLWIINTDPVPAVIYQQRSPDSGWAPGKLDVSAGGHYMAGEEIMDGLREVQEELGKNYDPKSLVYLGRKMHVGTDTKNRTRKNLVDIFMVEDNSTLDTYFLQESEVCAICVCPISGLIKSHIEDGFSMTVKGQRFDGAQIDITVTKDSFPYNWDNYHFKMVLLADRFVKKDKFLIY